MTQPDYVPLIAADRVRPVERLPVPDRWAADRPADLKEPGMPKGPRLGSHELGQQGIIVLAGPRDQRDAAGPLGHAGGCRRGCVLVGLAHRLIYHRPDYSY